MIPKNPALREFYAEAVNVTGVWKHCSHRACARAKRCVAASPACFERHPEIFREFMREKIGPRLRGEIALPQSDAGTRPAPARRNALAG